jgi:hypothetical protein
LCPHARKAQWKAQLWARPSGRREPLEHKDLETTQIYAKVQQEHLRKVMNRLGGMIPLRLPHNRATRLEKAKIRDSDLLEDEELTVRTKKNWLGDRDSNPDQVGQSHPSYH